MDKNVEKIIEALGYTIENDKLGMTIYDSNHKELKKKIIYEDNNNITIYTSENGHEIEISNDGYMIIKLDDNTRIYVSDINYKNEGNSITIYLGPDNHYNYLVEFEFYKGSSYGCIHTEIRENTTYGLHYENYNESVSIQENYDGAYVCYLPYRFSTHLDDNKHLSIEECTNTNYYTIIFDFIDKVAKSNYEESIKKAFSIISPCLVGMIDEIIDICIVKENKKEKKH